MSDTATPQGPGSFLDSIDPARRALAATTELHELLGRSPEGRAAKDADASSDFCVLVGRLSEADQLRALELVAVASKALDALEMRFLVGAERSNVSVRLRGHRLRRWWANRTGSPRAIASERVRVAARLSEWFPLLAAAMDRGELSFAHAARLIRAATPEVLDGLQSIEPDLVCLASSQTFEQFERDLLMIVDRLSPDGPAPDESRVNQVRITNEFGNTRVSGLLDPVRGEIVANALKQSVDAIRREREQQHALEDAEPGATSGTDPGLGLGADPGDRIGALQAEGLVRICQTALSAPDLAGSIPTAHIDVIVRADDPTLATTRNGESIVPDAVMDSMCCNAIYRVISMDTAGVPLRMGRARRLATPDQRRAVFARDGGCVFPGCGAAPRDCDVHHVHHWVDGGVTDLENLATLCRFHHSVTHSTGWTMNSAKPGSDATADPPFEWRTPTGALLKSERRIPGIAARLADPAAVERANDGRSTKTPGKLSQEPNRTDGPTAHGEPDQPGTNE